MMIMASLATACACAGPCDGLSFASSSRARQAFNCGLGFRRRIARWYFKRRMGHYVQADARTASAQLERMQGWLGDGAGTRLGVAFPVVLLVAQFVLALNTGFLCARPLILKRTREYMSLYM